MYHTILVTLDTTETDRAILQHIVPLAKMMHSQVVLLHVADGWAARTFGPEAVSPEIQADQAYLQRVQGELAEQGVSAQVELAFGDPAKEIVRWVRQRHCDLVAMSTHGHRLWGDIVFGTTAQKVQHEISVPVLMLRSDGARVGT